MRGRYLTRTLGVSTALIVAPLVWHVSPAAAYHTCYTNAYTPSYRAEAPGTIISDADMSCNVTVTNVNIRLCIQVSNDASTWSDQTCSDNRVSGGVSNHSARGYWTCSATNLWYYRTSAYSTKTFDTGETSSSPWKYSAPLLAYC